MTGGDWGPVAGLASAGGGRLADPAILEPPSFFNFLDGRITTIVSK